jgi:hypothetical protein
MSDHSNNLECRVPANLLLEAAHQIFSCGKSPLVFVLLDAVLEQYPDHAHAHLMYRIYKESLTPPKRDAV